MALVEPQASERAEVARLHESLTPTEPPDIIEFVTSPEYLGRSIYPRQGTLLKVIFLATELLTDYDYQVLEEWSEGFRLPQKPDPDKPLTYDGDWGIQPDILERIDLCKAEGRKWFREVLAVIGRRGGKGFIGALCGAYVMWHYICTYDPQDYYSIDRDKRLAAMVYAGKKDQAKANQWRDLVNVILGAPCYSSGRYGNLISRPLGEALTVFAPHDRERIAELHSRGVDSEMDMATFEAVPKEATLMGGRGPASFLIFFDEMAHVVATGASRGADELYDSATPSLDQFGKDGFIYAGSSPWEMIGKFYELCQNALEVEHGSLDPVHYDKLIIQLTSWDIYEDWERAHQIPLVPKEYARKQYEDGNTYYTELRERPDGKIKASVKRFGYIKSPVQVYDAQMQRLERANPETFKVERRSKWAATQDAYLNPVYVDRMFEPWQGNRLEMQSRGILSRTYAAHADPSKSGANFGWSIAHVEGPDEDGLLHVVFDKIHFWSPEHYEDGQIDYIEIGEQIGDDVVAFMPEIVTFDQFNSIEAMQRIRRRVRERQLPKHIIIEERTATAPLNWKMAETFKTALGMNLIHAPYHEQAELEAKFLQAKGNKVDHPTMGPVQTKDVWDTMANVTYALIGDQMAAFLKAELRDLSLGGAAQGGLGGGDPMRPSDQDIMDKLSAASRRGGHHGMGPTYPSRGGRR